MVTLSQLPGPVNEVGAQIWSVNVFGKGSEDVDIKTLSMPEVNVASPDALVVDSKVSVVVPLPAGMLIFGLLSQITSL